MAGMARGGIDVLMVSEAFIHNMGRMSTKQVTVVWSTALNRFIPFLLLVVNVETCLSVIILFLPQLPRTNSG